MGRDGGAFHPRLSSYTVRQKPVLECPGIASLGRRDMQTLSAINQSATAGCRAAMALGPIPTACMGAAPMSTYSAAALQEPRHVSENTRELADEIAREQAEARREDGE